jgi:hypothetical protein
VVREVWENREKDIKISSVFPNRRRSGEEEKVL